MARLSVSDRVTHRAAEVQAGQRSVPRMSRQIAVQGSQRCAVPADPDGPHVEPPEHAVERRWAAIRLRLDEHVTAEVEAVPALVDRSDVGAGPIRGSFGPPAGGAGA